MEKYSLCLRCSSLDLYTCSLHSLFTVLPCHATSHTHAHACASLQTEASAARLAEKLSSWGALGTGAAEAPQAHAGHFRVAALQPRSLNIQNVPPTVLIRDDQITTSSLVRHYHWASVSGSCRPHGCADRTADVIVDVRVAGCDSRGMHLSLIHI